MKNKKAKNCGKSFIMENHCVWVVLPRLHEDPLREGEQEDRIYPLIA